ncbi:LysR substrate-binding domain-containing protein [Pigmentiphaga sp. NML080357]|uniref:LysR substrate-binding domain-containing protein n=1 Tax=Pigmentiphaga sp. NML080357 TaxID=2008675 RepID=UPI001E49874A|nr:LysR substrate-binding domain-containing protein [Pigmentiphaga sp. NML080357]
MIDLRRVRYFVAVAEELHFGRAAQRLGMSQPPLSQQLQALEQDLGVRLLDRNKRQVALTEAGRLFLPEARALLVQAERAASIAALAGRGEMGTLRVGFTESAVLTGALPNLLSRFRGRYPAVAVQLTEQTSQQQIQSLVDKRTDVGFMRLPASGALPGELEAQPLVSDPLVAVLPREHRLASSGGALGVAALADEPFVFFTPGAGTGVYNHVLNLCRSAGYAPRIAQEAREVMTIAGLVAARLGVSILPASVRRLDVAGVVIRALREPEAASKLWLAFRREEASATGAAFWQLARQPDES